MAGRLRALGTRHSFNDLADTAGTLITVTGIDPDPVLDEAARTVTVGGGIRYGVLARWLEERGWALHNMGSLPHISVAGAIATGTHGSGIGNRRALDRRRAGSSTWTHGGDLASVRARRRRLRRARSSGSARSASSCASPSTSSRAYHVRQDVFHGLPWDAVLDDLDGVHGRGYSVSLFNDWLGDTLDQAWVKTRIDAGAAVPDEWFGAARDPNSEGRLIDLASENLTAQGGVPGPWLERLPHFRLDDHAERSATRSRPSTSSTARDGPAALRAVRALGSAHRPAPAHHRAAHRGRRRAVAEPRVSSGTCSRSTSRGRTEPEAVARPAPRSRRRSRPSTPAPHWGKVHRLDAAAVARVHPRLADARALFERLDPDARFSNARLESWGLRTPR